MYANGSSLIYVNFTVNNVICNENNYTLMEIGNDGVTIVKTSPVYPVLIDDRLIVNISITNMTHYIRLLAVNDIGNDTSDDIMIMRDDDIPQVITSTITISLSSSYSDTNTDIISITNTIDTNVTTMPSPTDSIDNSSGSNIWLIVGIFVPLMVLVIVAGIVGAIVFITSKSCRRTSSSTNHQHITDDDTSNTTTATNAHYNYTGTTTDTTEQNEPLYQDVFKDNRHLPLGKSVSVPTEYSEPLSRQQRLALKDYADLDLPSPNPIIMHDALQETSEYSEPLSRQERLAQRGLEHPALNPTSSIIIQDIQDTPGYSEVVMPKKNKLKLEHSSQL
jgi:hypothetical protein